MYYRMAYFDRYYEDRNLCYGKRVGDIVRIYCKDHFDFTTEVLGPKTFANNNSLYVIWKDGTIKDYIAEYCDIVTKIEDREKDSVHRLELIVNEAFKKLIDTPNWYKEGEFKFHNYSWIHRQIIIPYRKGTCNIETMVDLLALSKMQVTDPKKSLKGFSVLL